MSEKEQKYCILTGKPAERSHILTQKAYPEFKECEWNIFYLSREKHQEWHRIGRNSFIEKYNLVEEMLNRGFFFDGNSWRKHKE